MNTKQLIAGALAGSMAIASLAFATSPMHARPAAAIKEDEAQLKADEAALAWEKARLQSDRKTQQTDMRAGRLSAMSNDALLVYQDKQAIKGEQKDIASDKPGSLQMKMDQAALQREENQLSTDDKTFAADTHSGKMAATSADEENIYQDRQAIKAQTHAIASDRVKLKIDETS
jgi:hypothetical protein